MDTGVMSPMIPRLSSGKDPGKKNPVEESNDFGRKTGSSQDVVPDTKGLQRYLRDNRMGHRPLYFLILYGKDR